MASGKDGSIKVVVTAIAGNTAVTISKFVGWSFTGSASMLAEAVHSLADTFNQILLFVGIQRSKQGPSKYYPWGTGQARYVWNLVSAVGIFFVGFGVTAYHGVHSLMEPRQVEMGSSLYINLGILFFALLVEGYALLVAYKEVNSQRGDTAFFAFLKQSDDPTTLGVLFEDAVAVLGIIIAMICIALSRFLGSSTPDAIGALIIAVLLGFMALMLARINGILLIGVAPHESKVNAIREFIESFPEVEQLAHMKTVVIGSGQLHLALEIEFHGERLVNRDQISLDVEKIRDGENPAPILVDTAERMVRVLGEVINQFESKIKLQFPEVVTIELELH